MIVISHRNRRGKRDVSLRLHHADHGRRSVAVTKEEFERDFKLIA
jgi:hypothetical protein